MPSTSDTTGLMQQLPGILANDRFVAPHPSLGHIYKKTIKRACSYLKLVISPGTPTNSAVTDQAGIYYNKMEQAYEWSISQERTKNPTQPIYLL